MSCVQLLYYPEPQYCDKIENNGEKKKWNSILLWTNIGQCLSVHSYVHAFLICSLVCAGQVVYIIVLLSILPISILILIAYCTLQASVSLDKAVSPACLQEGEQEKWYSIRAGSLSRYDASSSSLQIEQSWNVFPVGQVLQSITHCNLFCTHPPSCTVYYLGKTVLSLIEYFCSLSLGSTECHLVSQ